MGIRLFGALYVAWSVGYYFCFVLVTSLVKNYAPVTDMLAEELTFVGEMSACFSTVTTIVSEIFCHFLHYF
jgi:hypothetical protein